MKSEAQPSWLKRSKDRQSRYLSMAFQLEETGSPLIIRNTMMLVSLAIICFIIWSAFTNINEIARTPGEIVPDGYEQTVQHLEGGMVEKIYVRDGDMVEQGQPLIKLDSSGLREDLERAQTKQIALEMQEERLRAFIANRAPNFKRFGNHPELVKDQAAIFASMSSARKDEQKIVIDQVEQKKQAIAVLQNDLKTAQNNHAIVNDVYKRQLSLNQKGYVSDIRLLETKQRLNDTGGTIRSLQSQIDVAKTEMTEFEARSNSLGSRNQDEAHEKLDLAMIEKNQNLEQVKKLQERFNRLEIKAPTKGLVQGLEVNTIGAVIQPGQTVLKIVPFGRVLEAKVKIPPQHIGHIKKGQPVQVKFSSFDFSRYGSVPGKLENISATTFEGEAGERYYQGRVKLDRSYVGRQKENAIVPGMTVMADIVTGEKTILDYLLKPVRNAMKTAFTER